MSDDRTLQFRIETKADTKGLTLTKDEIKALAKELAAAAKANGDFGVTSGEIEEKLERMSDAAKSAAPAAKTLGDEARQSAKEVNELGENFEKGAAAGRVLSQALSGNVLALGQLGPAIKSFGVLLKTNLIGTLITIGAVAAQFILPVIQGFNKTKSAADLAADAAKKADAALQLRKDAVDAVVKEIIDLGKRANDAEKELSAMQNRIDAVADSETALKLARVRADPKLTGEQKLEAEANIKRTADQAKFDGQQKVLADQKAVFEKSLSDAQAVVGKLESDQADLARRSTVAATAKVRRAEEAEAAGSSIVQAAGLAGPAGINTTAVDRSISAKANLANADEGLTLLSESSATLAQKVTAAKKQLDDLAATIGPRIKELAATIGTNATVRKNLIEAQQTDDRADQLNKVSGKIEEAKAAQSNARSSGNRMSEGIAASLVAKLESIKAELESRTISSDELTAALDKAFADFGGRKPVGSITGPDGQKRAITPLPAANTGSSITTVTKDGVNSSFAETSPGITKRGVEVRPIENIQKEIGEAAIDPALDAFFGPPAAVTDAQSVTDAIKNAPKSEPVSLEPVAQAFTDHAQQTFQNFQRIKVDIASLEKTIRDHTNQLRGLTNGLQAAREASQY